MAKTVAYFALLYIVGSWGELCDATDNFQGKRLFINRY
jgi:hypothetical protein